MVNTVIWCVFKRGEHLRDRVCTCVGLIGIA